MKNLPQAFQFLSPYLSGEAQGLAASNLPQASFFASIGHYFAERAGNLRMSFVLTQGEQILILHFRGDALWKEERIPAERLVSLVLRQGKTDDGVLQQTDLSLEWIISEDKKGNKKTKTLNIKALPALLGINQGQIQAPEAIQWAMAQYKALVQEMERRKTLLSQA